MKRHALPLPKAVMLQQKIMMMEAQHNHTLEQLAKMKKEPTVVKSKLEVSSAFIIKRPVNPEIARHPNTFNRYGDLDDGDEDSEE